MKMKRVVFAAVAAIMTGCVTNPPKLYADKSGHSKAWNLTIAAGLRSMKDIPYEKVAKMQKQTIEQGRGEAGMLGASTFSALNYLNPPTGFSSLGAGVMGFMSWFMVDPGDPASNTLVFGWMPKSMAADGDAAAKVFQQTVQDAVMKTSKTVQLPYSYSYDGEVAAPKGSNPSKWLRVRGDKCNQDDVRCGYAMWQGKSANEGFAPDALGGYEAWAFSYRSKSLNSLGYLLPSSRQVYESNHPDSTGTTKRRFALLDDIRFLVELSKNLPSWAYIYVSHSQQVSMEVEEGRYGFIRTPMVLHNGTAEYFIEPEPRS